jgi:hypothetical protein
VNLATAGFTRHQKPPCAKAIFIAASMTVGGLPSMRAR